MTTCERCIARRKRRERIRQRRNGRRTIRRELRRLDKQERRRAEALLRYFHTPAEFQPELTE